MKVRGLLEKLNISVTLNRYIGNSDFWIPFSVFNFNFPPEGRSPDSRLPNPDRVSRLRVLPVRLSAVVRATEQVQHFKLWVIPRRSQPRAHRRSQPQIGSLRLLDTTIASSHFEFMASNTMVSLVILFSFPVSVSVINRCCWWLSSTPHVINRVPVLVGVVDGWVQHLI